MEGEANGSKLERAHRIYSGSVTGKPRIQGTRIPASLILGYLAAERTYEESIAEFPDLKKEDILACLDYAREPS